MEEMARQTKPPSATAESGYTVLNGKDPDEEYEKRRDDDYGTYDTSR